MSRTLEVGFSPCPNDTFMFHGLVSGQVPLAGVTLQPQLMDIETLNQRALRGPQLPITKLSLPALAQRTDAYTILDAGAALGRGCGPLLVRHNDNPIRDLTELHGKRVAIPGPQTTAFLLLRSFCTEPFDTVAMGFERIMPAVASGQVDAGLIIHESRFTYADHGLACVADLGELWETATGTPLPLGVIAAHRSLGADLLRQLEDSLRASVQLAFDQPELSRDYIREHAQEMSDDVCRQHIQLYVNEFSLTLGATGRQAVNEMLQRGQQNGLLPAASPWR